MATRWSDLESLFERRIGPRGGQPVTAACWCMAWRAPHDEFRRGWGSAASAARATRPRCGRWSTTAACRACWRMSAASRSAGVRSPREKSSSRWSARARWLESTTSRCGRWSVFMSTRAPSGRVSAEPFCGAQSTTHARAARGWSKAMRRKPGDRDPFTGFESMFEAAGFSMVRPGGRRSTWRLEV